MTGLTVQYGTFVAGLASGAILVPDDCTALIKTGIADAVGVMLAGIDEPITQKLRDVLPKGGPESTILMGTEKRGAFDAAFINGAATHALDYDDVTMRGHTSTVLVPAIFAEAEALGSTGAQMIAAYMAGYEIWADLAYRDAGQIQHKGWHPTGVLGAISAAAACAVLRGLDAERATHAIAIGASQAGGLLANFGTMTKPFHAGRSAASGVLSARLAEAGMTGSPDAIEHDQGFLKAISPENDVDRSTPADHLGRDWRMRRYGISVKKYPVCYCGHRATDAILQIMRDHSIDPAQIASIDTFTSDLHAMTLRNARPQTGLEAKFSMQFDMAAGVLAGKVGLAELTDAFVQRADVQALMAKVSVTASVDYDPDLPGYNRADRVTVTLNDGSVIEGLPVTRATGHADLPLGPSELWTKFADCAAAAGWAEARARRLYDALMALDAAPGIAAILAQAQAVPEPA
ncbi:MmgE/PrpD family protein [Pseudooceanicola sp.]|uniref:MmgE/PrpD family protein n=1 Tax=Pseudooceanicola sp. TaxID=1914328 RepID=UPI002611F8AA|nr:MmgE/PrpD family protein [Pseudooceanicola sp.]MDF1855308.1 MmgE/PrpD family protein [Pseudooceanicola sp.]